MKCKTCGQSLHPDQKVCLNCGTETDRWPGRKAEVETAELQIPKNLAAMVGGGLFLLILIVVLVLYYRIIPPDQVAKSWLEAVMSRQVDLAKEYTTPKFESMIADRPYSAEMADQYYQFVTDFKPTCAVSAPWYNDPAHPTIAAVTTKLIGNNGQSMQESYRLVRVGRAWKLDGLAQ